MRLRCNPQAGSVLVISLAFSVILGAILATYLGLVGNQNALTARSQAWNMAISAAEAAVEEALAQLQCTTNLQSNGWSLTNGCYVKSRTLGDNSYAVGISNAASPAIYATGFVTCAESANLVSRRIIVRTQVNPLIGKGIASKGTITLSGNVMVDSFNSADTNYSTGGSYDPAKAKDNGSIATDGQIINSITASGNTTIYGHLSTGPNGTVNLSSNVKVGSKAYIQGGGTGLQPGWSAQDMNVNFPDVQAPFSGGAFLPLPGLVGTTNFSYVLGSGNYQMASLSLSGSSNMAVTNDAVLYVTGNVNISGNAYVYIAPGASLKLYCGGSSASFTGNGFVNGGANANNFYFYGLPGNTSVSVSGNTALNGVIYAPEASLSMSGNGDFAGSIVANSTTVSGNVNFHYDENLANVGPSQGYVIAGWNEF